MKKHLYAGILMVGSVALGLLPGPVQGAGLAQRLRVSENKRFLVLDEAARGFPPPGQH